MKTLFEQMGAVTLWGLLPVFLSFTMLIATVLQQYRVKSEKPRSIKGFYGKGKRISSEALFYCRDHIQEAGFLIAITMFLIVVARSLNEKYEAYVHGIIRNVGVVSSVVIGMTTIGVALLVVILVLDKQYYLIFSIREVLQKYRFSEWICIVMVCCCLVSGTTILLLNEEVEYAYNDARVIILEIATVYNLIGVAYTLCVITIIMIYDQKRELRLLDNCYRRFWLQKVDTMHFKSKKSWDKEAVDINVQYLLERYLDVCKRKKIERIEDIEFVSTEGIYREKWNKKAKCKYRIVLIACYVTSIFWDIVVLKEACCKIVMINILFPVIVALLMRFVYSQSYQTVLTEIWLDTFGYYIHTNDDKDKWIPRVSVWKTNTYYYKFIMRMNNLNAFFRIWIDYADCDDCTIVQEVEEVLHGIRDLESKCVVPYFPVFTIGFFLFSKDIRVECIRDAFCKVVLTESKHSVERMIQSQLYYFGMNSGIDYEEYMERVKAYLLWIKK